MLQDVARLHRGRTIEVIPYERIIYIMSVWFHKSWCCQKGHTFKAGTDNLLKDYANAGGLLKRFVNENKFKDTRPVYNKMCKLDRTKFNKV